MTYLAFPRLFAHASCPSGEAMFVLQFLLFGNYILMFWYLAVCLQWVGYFVGRNIFSLSELNVDTGITIISHYIDLLQKLTRSFTTAKIITNCDSVSLQFAINSYDKIIHISHYHSRLALQSGWVLK